MILRKVLRHGPFLLALVVIGLGSFFAGKRCAESVVSSKVSKEEEPTIIHHHPNKSAPVHVPNTDADACRILMICFPGADSIYKNLSECHDNMELILKYYHNSAIISKGQVVGFISFHLETAGSTAISMYNVCVDPAYRNRGLAKRMIFEGVEEMRQHEKLDKKLLLGLDVDLTTEFAAESFALYAKLGFFRGWQPCRSVGDVDWRPVIDNPESSLARSPMAEILASPKKYLDDEVMGKNPGPRLRSRSPNSQTPLTHFCMFRLYDESWYSMGKYLAATWQASAKNDKDGSKNDKDGSKDDKDENKKVKQ